MRRSRRFVTDSDVVVVVPVVVLIWMMLMNAFDIPIHILPPSFTSSALERPLLVAGGTTAKYRSPSLLDRSGGILYRTGIIPSSAVEWDIIYHEVLRSIPLLRPESKSSIAQHRLGIVLSSSSAAASVSTSSPTVQILKDPKSVITKYINRIAATERSKSFDYEYVLSPDIPVEIRSYELLNANMNWHIDDVLYTPIPQIEVILTIINTSDCRTMWQIEDNNNTNRNNDTAQSSSSSTTTKTHCVETDPNSILCLRAGVTSHCVTNLHYGKRIILKCAYIPILRNTSTTGGNTDCIPVTTYIGHVPSTASSTCTKKGKQTNRQKFQSPQFQHLSKQQQQYRKRG